MDEKRQEFVPKEEASVLPKYLDNVDAELEGHLVTIPVVQDEEFKAETVEKKEILDYGDEGEAHTQVHIHTHVHTRAHTYTHAHTHTLINLVPPPPSLVLPYFFSNRPNNRLCPPLGFTPFLLPAYEIMDSPPAGPQRRTHTKMYTLSWCTPQL